MNPPEQFKIGSLAGESSGDGPPVVLLHGLTATRRYVLMGSRLLERRGYRLVSYDARGHGDSAGAPERDAYGYEHLTGDLGALMDELGLERAVLAGNSMGAATALSFALAHPERVAALVQITPAYDGSPHDSPEEVATWTRLADALEREGVDGFLAAYEPPLGGRWHEIVMQFTRQRLERHRHPGAVADALRVVPVSAAFDGLEPLRSVRAPTLIVGSRDEADPLHPLAVAEAYAERLPHAELVVEGEGESPLAWRGAQLSRRIATFLSESGYS